MEYKPGEINYTGTRYHINSLNMWECNSCGRQYEYLFGEEIAEDKCTAEDCPSHWEEQGIPFPG